MSEGIPEGWEIKTIKDCVEQFKNGYAFSSSGYVASGIPIISIVNISLEGKFKFDEAREKKWSIDDSKKLNGFEVYDGDLIIAMTDVTPSMDMIGRGAIVKRNIVSLLNQRVGLIKTKIDLDKTYLAYFLNGNRWRKTAKRSASLGAQANLGTADILSSSILLPPLLEQKKIASILTSVDEVIANTQKQIDKLQDLKKATMNELLTKGIGHTEFKDSLLGRIPKSWEVKILSEITSKIGDGIHSTPKYSETGTFPFINGNNLVNGEILFGQSTKRVNKNEFEKHRTNLGKETLLLSINGTIGNLAFYKGESVVLGKSVAYLTFTPNFLLPFAYYLLSSDRVKRQFEKELTGTTIDNLSLKSIRNTPVIVPTISEQQKISEIISSIDLLIQKIQNKLIQTQSLKKSLMQDLLTGKVRVSVN